ncbi:MAG TPA: hypothetical protein VLP43_07860, partial [Solirubrobacteraceae bacterium]|nr:hypothetical protein [Solirubrobacteraceae bacterium]
MAAGPAPPWLRVPEVGPAEPGRTAEPPGVEVPAPAGADGPEPAWPCAADVPDEDGTSDPTPAGLGSEAASGAGTETEGVCTDGGEGKGA